MAVAPTGGESCSTKASGTRGGQQTDETTLDEHGVDEQLTRWDWILPGLGESGPKCEADAVPPGNAICPNGDSMRYEPLRCRRVECPNCYKDEQVERLFRITVELEAYAKFHDERPHAVVASVPEKAIDGWTYEKLNTSLCRRSYRRMRRKCDIVGGYAVLHPWRVRKGVKQGLRRRGYGPGGDKGGYWAGIRGDVLDRGDARKYAKFSPHLHNIGFPEWIEPHEGDDFLVRKYDELEGTHDVVRHARYLLSHRGVRDGDDVGRSVRPWGAFHHASEEWGGAEEELDEAAYTHLCKQVAEVLGYSWDEEEGLVHPETANCPECGVSVDKFHDLRDLPDLVDGYGRMGEPWVEQLETEQREFFSGLFDEWRDSLDEDGRGVELDGLEVPDSVTVWSVDDEDGAGGSASDGAGELDVGIDASEAGEMSQQKRRRAIVQQATGRGIPREELLEKIDAPADTVEHDIEQLLRDGTLIDAGIGRVQRA